ncbi:MAG: M4 family metallopeptidase [Saprospiraceae bacterium]|nr:M4 family metallopeptidase [Saprospiraceae bacterium]
MRKLFIHVCLISLIQTISAQVYRQSNIESHLRPASHTWQDLSNKLPDAEAHLADQRNAFAVPADNALQLVANSSYGSGLDHLKYQHHYKGLEVVGSEWMVHVRDHRVVSANGNLPFAIELDVTTSMAAEDAIRTALVSQSPGGEQPQLHAEQPPVARLVIIDAAYPEQSGQFHLAYQVDIYSTSPLAKRRYYIDACNGEVLLSHDLLMSCFGADGTGETLYHGLRTLSTTASGGGFELNDATRGNGIETISVTGRKYSDDDNFWEAGSFAQKNGALDVHFGAQSTFDYYKTQFARKGVDGNDGKLLNRIIDTTFYVNAFWDGAATNFGIGDSVNTKPLTSLDVVAHEITHGLTQHTCGLEYLYESGALNEGFSDIIGKAVEFEYDSAQFNWLLGQRFFIAPDTAFRSMSDPLRFKNPKNYKGTRWITNASDNGGVHTNSGVINYWFYLLSVGDTGVTEKNIAFDVKKIGIREAVSIVYEAMAGYLGKTSKYYDMREATLQIAEQRYGKCSAEYANIVEAWVAVGMGARHSDPDVMLVNEKIPQLVCKEAQFPVEVRIVNLSCDKPVAKGTVLTLKIEVPRRNPISETYTLQEDLLPGESHIYAFNKQAYVDRTNTLIQITVAMDGDADTTNNRLPLLISKNNNAEYDFRVNSINIQRSPCEGTQTTAQVVSTYLGCHPVEVGTELKLIMAYGQQISERSLIVNRTIYPGASYRSDFFPVSRDFRGLGTIEAILSYAKDTNTANNSSFFQAIFTDNVSLGYLEPFDNFEFDTSHLTVYADSSIHWAVDDRPTQSAGVLMSGGKLFNPNGSKAFINSADLATYFSANPKFKSQLYNCLSTDGIQKAYFSFDFLQKVGNPGYDTLLTDVSLAAVSRVLFYDKDGKTTGGPFYILQGSPTPISGKFQEEIPLENGPVTILIENIVLEGAVDSLSGQLDLTKDFIHIDNLYISAEPSANDDQFAVYRVEVHPNPFDGSIHIDCRDAESLPVHFELFDFLGNSVYHGPMVEKTHVFEARELPSGSYLLSIRFANGHRLNRKLVKI